MPLPGDPRQLMRLLGAEQGAALQQQQQQQQQQAGRSPVLPALRGVPTPVALAALALPLAAAWQLSQAAARRQKQALSQRASLNRARQRGAAAAEAGPAAAAAAAEEPPAASRAAGAAGVAADRLPQWLGLPLVHFLQLPGGQLPSFTLQPRVPDQRSWLVFEAQADAAALQRWFIAHGQADLQSRVASAFPLAFLWLAGEQARGVAFVPAGALPVAEELAEEDLWVAIMGAADSLPLQAGSSGAASVEGVVSRFFDAEGRALAAQPQLPGAQQQQQEPLQAQEPVRSRQQQQQQEQEQEQELVWPRQRQQQQQQQQGQEPVWPRQQEQQQQPPEASSAAEAGPPEAAASSSADPSTAATAAGELSSGAGAAGSQGPDAESPAASSGSGAAASRQLPEDAAAVEEAMQVIQETAQAPKAYVPKAARRFVEGFTAREQQLQAAAAADPAFSPLAAAEQLEADEIETILSPARPPPVTAADLGDRELRYGTLGEQPRPAPEQPEPAAAAAAEASASAGSSSRAAAPQQGEAAEEAAVKQSLRELWEEAGRRAREAQAAQQPSSSSSSSSSGGGQERSSSRASSSDPAAQAAGPHRGSGWWRQLPALFLLRSPSPDGGPALLSIDISAGGEPENVHAIGFEDSQDALRFMALYRSCGLGECSVAPMTPAQAAADGLGSSRSGLTVFRRKQLPLSPALSEADLTGLLVAHARAGVTGA